MTHKSKLIAILISYFLFTPLFAALTDVGYLPQARVEMLPIGDTPTVVELDDADKAIALIFIAPKTGNITKVGCNVTASDGAADPDFTFGIEGKAAGNREPDGTYLGGGSPASVTATGDFANGWAWYTLDNVAAVTAGSKYAATIRYSAGTIGASNSITVALKESIVGSVGMPYSVEADGSAVWNPTVATRTPMLSAQYSDGAVLHGTLPYDTIANDVWSTSGSPTDLFRGTKWTPSFSCRVVGVICPVRTADNADFELHMYTGTSSTVSTVVDPGEMGASAGGVFPLFIPLTPTNLTASTAYRFVIKPTTTTAQNTFTKLTFLDTDSRYAFSGDLQGTVSSDDTPTAWTDSDTTFYQVIPVIDQIDVAAAAGRAAGANLGGVLQD